LPSINLATFNVENLLVRFNFRKFEQERLATLLDIDSDIDRANLIRTHWNVINEENRVATALTIRAGNPDMICLQEIENMHSLKMFHDRYLRRIFREYEHKMLIEANDPRGIDVAVLSKFKFGNIKSHQDLKGEVNYPEGPKTERIFRRDCLELDIKVQNKILPVFVCHFKSMSGGRQKTRPIREAEAKAVKAIIEERFGDPSSHDWIIAGDLNDFTETDGILDDNHGLHDLLNNDFSFNIMKNITEPEERWSHFYAGDNSYHQLDYILVSPSLKEKNPDTRPIVFRGGLPYRADRFKGDRWPRIGYDGPKASDHAMVVAKLIF